MPSRFTWFFPASLLLLAACSDDNPITPPATGTIAVRVVHAISDGPMINVDVNGAVVISDLAFGTALPGTGASYATINAAPALSLIPSAGGTALLSATLASLSGNGQYTVIALGNAAEGAAPADTVVAFADTSANDPASTLIRVVNAVDFASVAGGDPVDVYIYPTGEARPETPELSALAWAARSAYVSKSAGEYTIDVYPAGNKDAPLFSGALTAVNGGVRTLVLVDPTSEETTGSILTLSDRD